jgi:hypothetical protein
MVLLLKAHNRGSGLLAPTLKMESTKVSTSRNQLAGSWGLVSMNSSVMLAMPTSLVR